MGRGVDPVALGALAVSGGDHPPRGREPAVVVGEVDIASPWIGIPSSRNKALGTGIGPNGRTDLDKAVKHDVSCLHPVTLQALAECAGDEPSIAEAASALKFPVIVCHDKAAFGRCICSANHVTSRMGVVGPARGGVPGDAGVRRGVHPVALQALAVGGGDHPARGREPAVVVGEVDEAVLRGVPPARDVALGQGVVGPARGGVPGDAGVRRGVHPVALQALAVGGGDNPARRREPAVVVGQVDEAVRGGVGAADDVALGAGVGPRSRPGLDEPAHGERSVRVEPIALKACDLAPRRLLCDNPTARYDATVSHKIVVTVGLDPLVTTVCKPHPVVARAVKLVDIDVTAAAIDRSGSTVLEDRGLRAPGAPA